MCADQLPERPLEVLDQSVAAKPKPLVVHPPLYSYIRNDCESGSCRKCWRCIQATGPDYYIPSAPAIYTKKDTISITVNLFRFEEEARRFLSLAIWDKPERAVILDLSSMTSLNVQWRRCQSARYPDQPGGCFDCQFTIRQSSLQRWTPAPISEVFQTIPSQGTTQPQVGPWPFYFQMLR